MSAVLFDTSDRVAWITLNRPEAKNLMNAEVFVGLRDAWQEFRSNDDLRVAVVTGAGDEDFSCGGDLSGVIPIWTGARQPETDAEHALLADPQILSSVFFRDEPCYKPIVAAVNGRALGGGCELLLATDVRVAAEHATFALPEAKSGIVPGAGSMVRLSRQIAHADAMKLLLTGDTIDAAEARRIGLVSEVVPADQLRDRAGQLAERIAANGPVALRAIKRTVVDSHTADWPDAFAIENAQSGAVMASKDAREGPRAFKEKRTPDFQGR